MFQGLWQGLCNGLLGLGCWKMSDDSYSSNQRVLAEKRFTISLEGSWSSGNPFPELMFQTQEIEQRLQTSNYPTKTKNKNGIPQSIHHFFTRNNCKNLTTLLVSDKKSIPCLETWIPQTTSISKVQEELRQRSVEEIKREEKGKCGKLVSRAHWDSWKFGSTSLVFGESEVKIWWCCMI